jgi:NAD(P)-dependent dehydrogenase (short-subunit alcohol dehydrogenase family)
VVTSLSLELGNVAAERMQAEVPGGQVRVVELDLASLKSVKQCAEELLASEPAIHLLINNAG